MSYTTLQLLHQLVAFFAAGPLFLAPWIVFNVSPEDPALGGRLAVLQQVEDVWSRLGWLLVITGVGLFAWTDWRRSREPWFLLAVGIFLFDVPIEKWLRDPAIQLLRGPDGDRRANATALFRLRLGVGLQTAGIAAIIALMIRQSIV